MSHSIDKPLHIGKTDTYSLTVSEKWLNGETIQSATPTTDSGHITLGSVSIVDNIIYVYLTGVSATVKGGIDVHFDYTTATRSDCDFIKVKVEDC